MAIVINGSGTVTGLAVGGLPDGTVDSGTIATGTIVDADVNDLAASKLTGALPAISGASLVMPRFKEFDQTIYTTATTSTVAAQSAINISGSTYVTLTPEHVDDIFEFTFQFKCQWQAGYGGWGIQRATDTGFTANVATIWANGRYAEGQKGLQSSDGGQYFAVSNAVNTLATGLSVDTPYYFRMIGMTHNIANHKWGFAGTGDVYPSAGIVYSAKRWSIL